VEQGTHQELLAKGGLYKRLTEVQLDQDSTWDEAKPVWDNVLSEN